MIVARGKSWIPVAFVTLLGGCTAKPVPEPQAKAEVEVAPEVEAAATVEAAAAPGAEAGPEVEPEVGPEPAPMLTTRFWTVSQGLTAYDLDGKKVASLGDVGDHARRLPDGRIVVLADDGEQLSLVVLDAKGQVSRRVEVPNAIDSTSCAIDPLSAIQKRNPDGYADALGPQQASDFTIDLTNIQACLNLQDRNSNMSNYELAVAVNLGTGQTTSAIKLDLEGECGAKGKATIPAGVCDHANRAASETWIEPAVPAKPAANDWPFAVDEDHWVTRSGKRSVQLCRPDADPDDWSACSETQDQSPSGRWQRLTGVTSEGDYIHVELVLLDRSTGKLLGVSDGAETPSFVDIAPAQLLAADQREAVMATVGESEVAWLPEDRLWVDGKLLIPERREIVAIGGQLASTLTAAP